MRSAIRYSFTTRKQFKWDLLPRKGAGQCAWLGCSLRFLACLVSRVFWKPFQLGGPLVGLVAPVRLKASDVQGRDIIAKNRVPSKDPVAKWKTKRLVERGTERLAMSACLDESPSPAAHQSVCGSNTWAGRESRRCDQRLCCHRLTRPPSGRAPLAVRQVSPGDVSTTGPSEVGSLLRGRGRSVAAEGSPFLRERPSLAACSPAPAACPNKGGCGRRLIPAALWWLRAGDFTTLLWESREEGAGEREVTMGRKWFGGAAGDNHELVKRERHKKGPRAARCKNCGRRACGAEERDPERVLGKAEPRHPAGPPRSPGVFGPSRWEPEGLAGLFHLGSCLTAASERSGQRSSPLPPLISNASLQIPGMGSHVEIEVSVPGVLNRGRRSKVMTANMTR